MNKTLLLLAVAGGLTAQMEASFWQSVKEKFKQIAPTASETLKGALPGITKKAQEISPTLGSLAQQTQKKFGSVKVYPKDTNINFEFRNKSGEVWVSVDQDGQVGEIKKIGNGRKVPQNLQMSVDPTKKTTINVWTSEPAGRPADRKYSVPENKDYYVTYDDNGLRQQTGEKLGIFDATSSGFSLANNVRTAQIAQG